MTPEPRLFLAFQRGCVDCRTISFILGVYEDINAAYAECEAADQRRPNRCHQEKATVYVLPHTTPRAARPA